MSVAVARDRRGVAVGDPESGHTLLAGSLRGLDRDSQTLPEADSDQYIFRGQTLNFVLQISFAPGRRFGVKAERHQGVSEVISQRSSQVGADNQNAPGTVDEPGQFDRSEEHT